MEKCYGEKETLNSQGWLSGIVSLGAQMTDITRWHSLALSVIGMHFEKNAEIFVSEM